jgi:hypothetical protein
MFSPPPIGRPLAIDNPPAIIIGEERERATPKSYDWDAITSPTNYDGTNKEDPNDVHLIPVDSEVTRMLSPNDITTS